MTHACIGCPASASELDSVSPADAARITISARWEGAPKTTRHIGEPVFAAMSAAARGPVGAQRAAVHRLLLQRSRMDARRTADIHGAAYYPFVGVDSPR
jgi:hypothetical protein